MLAAGSQNINVYDLFHILCIEKLSVWSGTGPGPREYDDPST